MSTSATSVQMPQVSMQFVGETLLIRQCYRDVKKIIADNFGLDEITLKQREKLNYFRTLIISGNPGIGKSCFAYYLLLYILQTGENVYYQIADTHYFFKPSEGKWYRVISERMFQERLLFKCRGWYLCDFDPSVKTYFHEDSVKSIVFTSPKANIFKQILKEGKARKYFLPVWTDEEISIFLDMHKTRVNLEKAKKRIEEWGNIPRMILSEANESLAQEIGKLNSLKDLEDQLNAVMDVDLNLPSKLVHLTPGPTYNYVTAKVCSELAKGCIYSRMMKKDRERAIEAAFSKDDGEKLSDWTLFECFSHDILKKGGMKNVRRLGKRPEECFAEEIRLVRSNVFEFLGGIESLNRVLRKQTYYKPASKNFPCVDALSLSEVPGELLLFQMTKANQHSISRTLLHDILTNVSARNNISRVNLVFVLPECQANAKSWKHTQSLKDGSNLKSRRGSFEDLGIELLQSALFLSRRDIE
uniref:Novel STAND NTPase 3 domain-containing protein n=1 Tax=Hanusia phi TaxID=3032 RepID=A0A7S0HPZ3_9CRYP